MCYARSKFEYALICEMRLTASVRPTKYYALNSEYVLISDMRLITRKYGNNPWYTYMTLWFQQSVYLSDRFICSADISHGQFPANILFV